MQITTLTYSLLKYYFDYQLYILHPDGNANLFLIVISNYIEIYAEYLLLAINTDPFLPGTY